MRRVRGIWAALLLCAPFAMLASPAQAASGVCTSNKGVTVVVDYGPLGGGVTVRCAANADGSGLSALHAAGFSTQGTIKDGPGVVCRINNRPSRAQEKCQTTPPVSAYWRYWHASNGGSWAYSQSGAANRRVTAGGFEGWTFTSAKPGVRPVRSGGSGAGASGAGRSTGSTDSGASGGSGTSGAKGGDEVLKKPSSSGDSALPQPRPRSKKTASQPSADSSEQAASPKTRDKAATTDAGGKSATPWIAGAILLALVGAIGATQVRRRRH